MAGKYDDLARAILENVGGKENVNSVAHCITRVRLKLKDEGKANTEAIEKLEGVIKVMQANGQYQVVVGNKVEDVYDAVVAVGGLVAGGEIDAEDDAPKGIAAKAIDLISGIFAPMLGTFAAAGIMKGILAAITQFVPEFANDGAYTILYTIADGMFYFLPVILAYTASKKFRMNEFTGMAIGLALVNLTTLGYDYILGAVIAHSFSLGAVLFAMYLKNKDENFRGICLPAIISSFFFGVTEPAIYGVALPDKKAFVVASIGSAVGGLIIGLTGAMVYISGGLGVFNWLSFLPTDPASTVGIMHMVWAIVASLAGAAVGFVIEYATYKPEAAK